MKTKPTQKTAPVQATKTSAPDNETNNKIRNLMKNLVTLQLDNVTLHHKGADYTYPRKNGAVEIPAADIGNIPEAVALLIVLLAGAKRVYLARETYFAVREGVWFHLDRANGGITEAAHELFEDDEEVLEAAKLNREAHARKPNKK